MGSTVDLGTRETFADVGQTIGEIFGMKQLEIGTSFLKKLKL
jgi:phosphopentomutase